MLIARKTFSRFASSDENSMAKRVSSVEVNVDCLCACHESIDYLKLSVLEDIVYEGLFLIQGRLDVCSSFDE